MSWRVRRAEPGDAAALALVAGATFLETFHAVTPVADLVAHVASKSSPAVFGAWMADEHAAVFYAAADGTGAPVGYAVLTAPDFPIALGPDDTELRRIYTLQATHGSGLGGALMQAVTDEARARGHGRVLLGVHPENDRARRFYERSGFRVIGERVFQVGASRFVDPIYALDL